MPERIEIGALREHTGPFRWTLAEANALIRAAKERPIPRQTESRYVRCSFIGYNNTGAIVPKYSIFGLKDTFALGEDGTLRVNIEKITNTTVGAKSCLFTNGSQQLATASYGNIYSINQLEPILLQLTDSTTVPLPGETCGPDIAASKVSIIKTGTGLVCLSAVVPDIASHNYIWCLRDSGGCDTSDASWQFTLFGNCTGGTWSLTATIVAATTVAATATFQWNDSAANINTAMLAAFSNLSSGNFTVSGGPAPNATITMAFRGTAGEVNQVLPNLNWTLTGGAGIGIICLMSQLGHP